MMSGERKRAVEQAIVKSFEYVLSNQLKDGHWLEWYSPPGESDQWATAFIGYKLKSVPNFLKDKMARSTRAASKWLLGNMNGDGGWGYNRKVGTDADSTSHAILFLALEGEAVPEKGYNRLLAFQCPDGGFSTYADKSNVDSWVVSHEEVTPIALLALLTKYPSNDLSVNRGIKYVLEHRLQSGLWNSFWWPSNLYSIEANLSLLNTIKVHVDMTKTRTSLLEVKPKNAFETALLISSILNTSATHAEFFEPMGQLVGQLIREQGSDGSWKSELILRLTDHDCFEPWKADNCGPMFSDQNRLFTTSTVLKTLSKVYTLL